MSVTLEIIVILGLLALNGIFAMAEMAIVSSRKTRLMELAGEGYSGARAALKIQAAPGEFLSTIQIGITLIGVLAGAFGGATVARHLKVALEKMPMLADYAAPASVAIVVIIITFISLIMGELVPKQLALRNAEMIAIRMAGFMRILSKILYPLARVLNLSTNFILNMISTGSERRPVITEDEIRMMIDQATEAGVVKKTEQGMMKGVMNLGDLEAYDLMTPRHEVVWLDASDTPERNWARILESGHTYFPVIDGDSTHVIGLVSVKGLLKQKVEGKPLDLRAALAPPLYVAEKVPALRVLEKFKANNTHLALVVDEHGATEGLISINDLLKAVVGDITASGGIEEDPNVIERADGSWLVDGSTPITELKKLLKVRKLPREEEGDYTTLAGFIMSRLGRVPKTTDTFKWRSFKFEVIDMDRRRIDKVLIVKLPKVAAIKKTAAGDDAKPPKNSKNPANS